MALKNKPGTGVSGYTSELGTRISRAIDEIGGLKKSARFAGVTDETLASWRDGRSEPRFLGLHGLANAAGVSMDWLATGVEPDAPSSSNHPLDLSLFSEIIRLVEQWLDDNNRSLPPDKKADVISTLYEIAMETANETGAIQVDPNAVARILRLVA